MNGGELDFIKSQIESNGKAFTYTKGTSMLPMLKEDRDVSVLVFADREFRRGDVVLYTRKREKTELVLHRIIKELPGGAFLIRGDNTFSNETVEKEKIAALLCGFFRRGKYVDCQKSAMYRVYSAVWTAVYPLRKFFRIDILRAAAKVKRAVLKIF